MSSQKERCIYTDNQLADVICQLRFPEILTINAVPPAAFQEEIRSEYPQYSATTETPPPNIANTPEGPRLERQPATINYCFASADGVWRINLTSKFISIACSKYPRWEEFAKMLDSPLAAFIKTYKPAYFERIGLRYLNFVSRKALGLENTPYSELFDPAYLGILGKEGVAESATMRCNVDIEMAIRNGSHVKIHAGPGMVKKNGQTDSEIKFVFDQDLFSVGKIPVNHSTEVLENLHSQAFPIFRGAITDLLHNALNPDSID